MAVTQPSDEEWRRLLVSVRERALALAFSTLPCDRKRAEAALADAYRLNGCTEVSVVWMDNPLQALLLIVLAGPVMHPDTLCIQLALRRQAGPPRNALEGHLDGLLRSLRRTFAWIDGREFEERITRVLGRPRTRFARSLNRLLDGPRRSDGRHWAMQLTERLRGVAGAIEDQSAGLQVFAAATHTRDLVFDLDEFNFGIEDFVAQSLCELLVVEQLAPWMGSHGFGLDERDAKGAQVARELNAALGLCWVFDHCVICCERPVEWHLDDENRVHAPDRAAVVYADGYKIFAHHGVPVPDLAVLEPWKLTVTMIDQERNAEVRRALTEIYGYGRYLMDTGATVLDMDMIDVARDMPALGSMPRALLVDKHSRRWLVGTDGSTRRVYYMRVPDHCNTCCEAHSALAGFDEGRIIASS